MSSLHLNADGLNLAILAIVCGLVFFLFLGKIPFHDKGEPREALVVQDIVENGNWLYPLKRGQYLPSKPPLFHWVAAIVAELSGTLTEWSARFPSALFATLGVFLIYYFGSQFYGRETGFFAALMLATTAVYQDAAVEARVDMTLVFFVSLPLVLFFALYRRHLVSELWWYLFFIAIGTGVLAKGPVSLVISGTIIFVFIAFTKQWTLFVRLVRHPALLLAMAIFITWYGVALWKGGSDFAALQLLKENVARFFVYGEGGTGHQKPVYYFLLYLFPLGLPWTIFLPVVLWSYFKNKWFTDERALFLGIWIAVVLLFFSLSAGKRPPYILPLYVPLALLTARWCCRPPAEPAGQSKALQWLGWFAGAVGLTILVLSLGHAQGATIPSIASWLQLSLSPKDSAQVQRVQEVLDDQRWPAACFLLISGVVWMLVARDLIREKTRPAAIKIGVLGVFTILVIQGVVAPPLARALTYRDFVQSAKKIAESETLLLFPDGVDSSSLVFYGGSKIQLLSGDLDTLRQRLAGSRHYAILSERQWKRPQGELSTFEPVLRSRGTGPDGEDPLVLIRGNASP